MPFSRTFVLATAASSAAAVSAPSPPELAIYSANFTSDSSIKGDILSAIDQCETDLSCAGLSLEPNGTVAEATRLYRHSFVGGYKTEKTYETRKKEFTYHRGRIAGGTVLETVAEGGGAGGKGLTLADAKERCRAREDCVAFTYPVRSLEGLLTLPNVTFFSTLEDFLPDDADDWRTYVSNDPARISGGAGAAVNAEALPYDDAVAERPYRSCCVREDIPTMEEIVKADALERISCDISREEFFLRYEVPRKPVMLVGCEKDWPAVKEGRWLAENLAPRFSNHSRWRARIGGKTELKSESYKKNVMWGDIADAMLNDKPYYLFDQLYDAEAKVIDDDYDDPLPIKGGDLYEKLPHFKGPLRWFCHGPQGTGTKSHMDPFGTDAWNTVIKGHKWWLIYPQGFTDNDQLECEEECSVETPLVKHWYASVGINGARTEFPHDKYAQHVLQHPGETIYIPDGLIHSVYNVDETIAITKNYASAANLDKVWRKTVVSKDPMKWRMMYYHTLNRQQRRRVRKSEYWPPQRWLGSADTTCKSTQSDEMEEYPMYGYEKEWSPEVGELVEGRYREGLHDEINEWFTGWITGIEGDQYTIAYVDKDTDLLTLEHMRRLPKAGDVIEAKYEGKKNEWYKATVTRITPEGGFDVAYDDGDDDRDLPRDAIREFRRYRKNEMVQMLTWVEDEDGGDYVWKSSAIVAENDDHTYLVRRSNGEEVDNVTPAKLHRKKWGFRVGDEVFANISRRGDYKPHKGVVTKEREDDRYDLKLDDGSEELCVSWRRIRRSWARWTLEN